jgi:hypothetical protein
LPIFWLVLAAYALFPVAMGGKPPVPWWRFLTFTQNLGLQPGTAFSHAWSLCVEEQFYLVLPAVLAAGAWLARGRVSLTRTHGWALMGALVTVGIVARGVLWRRYGREDDGHIDGYMPWIYYATLCRFDEFIPGIAVAMLKNFHRPTWERLMAHGRALGLVGAAAVATMLILAHFFYDIRGYGWGFFMTAFGYSLVALSFALLVAAALSPAAKVLQWRIPGADRIALWSYSIYLSHKPLAVFSAAGDHHDGLHRGRRPALQAGRGAVHDVARSSRAVQLRRRCAADRAAGHGRSGQSLTRRISITQFVSHGPSAAPSWPMSAKSCDQRAWSGPSRSHRKRTRTGRPSSSSSPKNSPRSPFQPPITGAVTRPSRLLIQ